LVPGTRYKWLNGKGLLLLPSLAIAIAASIAGFGVVGAMVMWAIVTPVVVGGLWLAFAIERSQRAGSRGFVDVPCAWFEPESDSYHGGRVSETADGQPSAGCCPFGHRHAIGGAK